jgi:hypothetical protein
MGGFVVKATKPDGTERWLASPNKHIIRGLASRDSAAVFPTVEDAQGEADGAAIGYAVLGIVLSVESAA